MRIRFGFLSTVFVSVFLSIAAMGQEPTGGQATRVFAFQAAEVADWDARMTAMEASQELEQLAIHRDRLAPEWVHQRFQQRYRGLPVFGAQLVRHWRNGRVESINGSYHPGIDLDTTSRIGPEQSSLLAEGAAGAGARAVSEPELLVFPNAGGFVLAYKLHVRTPTDLLLFFIDATTGTVVDSWSDRHTQMAVVGIGTGTWDDTKKMSTTEEFGEFVAKDGLRPATAWTVDANGRFEAWLHYLLPPEGSAARDQDNDWDDGAVVDAHVYAGWTYDYYYKRFGRRGINDADRTVTSYVHYWPRSRGTFPPLSFNAFWDPFEKSVNYGDGDGFLYNYFSSALDVVAHELTHGVIQFTSALIYQDESGALNEAFCDIMSVGAEFFFEPRGAERQHADWTVGEDLYMNNGFGPNGLAIRNYANPGALQDPDHYSRRFLGAEDNGGVHTNSLIADHAFYLFVEGGTNRTSGKRVDGIGLENMEQAERIFYRAFTSYLVPTSDFSDARRATLKSARDLYGAGSRPEAELERAWNAVGVQ